MPPSLRCSASVAFAILYSLFSSAFRTDKFLLLLLLVPTFSTPIVFAVVVKVVFASSTHLSILHDLSTFGSNPFPLTSVRLIDEYPSFNRFPANTIGQRKLL